MNEYHKIHSIFKRDPETKRIVEGEYSLPEFEYLKDNIWEWSEKVDGCLHYANLVITDSGRLPIGKIVDSKLPVKILSYNNNTKIIEFKDIEYYHKEERTRPFLNISLKSRNKGNRPKHIVCTDNHKFFSNGCWVEAKNLEIGQKVSHLVKRIPYGVKQIILGGLLGDSSIYRPSETTRGFSFIHSIKQRGYFEFKEMLLGNLFRRGQGSQGGFPGSLPNLRGCSVINPTISDIILNMCEVNGVKKITKEWSQNLDPMGVAIWYMDDGSCNFSNTQKPRARFCTNSFSLDEVDILKQMFIKKYNIECDIFDYKGPTLVLSEDGTDKLFNLIFPYICDNMKYKLSKEYKDYFCVLNKPFELYDSLLDTEIIDVEKKLPRKYRLQQKYQYDISVKDNSNYFTNQILVHNTNIRIMYNGYPEELHKEMGVIPTISFGGKTDRAQIPVLLLDYLNATFLPKIDMFKEMFDASVCLYGEGYGPKIQKGGKYRSDHSFVLFDIKIGNWWLKRKDVEEIAKILNIDIVPIIGEGTLSEMVEKVRNGFNSTWGDFIAEGIVARPKVDLKCRNGERIITKIKYTDFRFVEKK
jgi:hypothetical protein